MSVAHRFEHIAARELYKDYGRQRALAGVSLQLRAGQVTALLGENGAGKSTLLSILAGMLEPTRGSVWIDDQPFASVDDVSFRRCLGVLSHEPRCYAELSPRENLQLFAQLYGLDTTRPDSARDSAIVSWLRAVNLERAADRPARTLSRGMLQRLAIARTLLHQPSLVLLDEPYTGLDQAGVAMLSTLITQERARGAMLLIVTHDLATVAPLCDQVLVLSKGRLGAQADLPFGSGNAERLLAIYRQADGRGPRGRAAADSESAKAPT